MKSEQKIGLTRMTFNQGLHNRLNDKLSQSSLTPMQKPN